jgi:hypothetical protein
MTQALVISPDLMAVSSISSAARTAGWNMQSIGAVAELVEKITADLRLLIIDLGAVTTPLDELVQQARLLAPGVTIVAFGPHVQSQLLREAGDSGCDVVCTRGEFMRRLPDLFH